MVCAIVWQVEFAGQSCKIHKVNVNDVRMTYPVDELIKCLPDEKFMDVLQSMEQIGNSWKTYIGYIGS